MDIVIVKGKNTPDPYEKAPDAEKVGADAVLSSPATPTRKKKKKKKPGDDLGVAMVADDGDVEAFE